MKSMIFAAGLGTRLKPLTDTMPKALVPVNGKPLVDHVVDKIASAGFNDIVVNVHHFADMIEEHFRQPSTQTSTVSIAFSDERAKLLETGGGIKHAAELLKANNYDGRFLIHNVDILSNVNLVDFWHAGEDTDAILLVSKRETQRYLIFDSNNSLVGWTNVKTGQVKSPYPHVREVIDPTCRLYAFAGIHQMSTNLLPLMDAWPDAFSIIDFYLSICATHRIKAYIQPNLRLMDVGKLDTLHEADAFAASL